MNASTEQPFTAAFTRDQLHERERHQNGWDSIRRGAFAVLTRDHDQLAESVTGDIDGCETFLDLAEDIKRLQDQRKAEDELLESAWARLMFVLNAEGERIDAKEVDA